MIALVNSDVVAAPADGAMGKRVSIDHGVLLTTHICSPDLSGVNDIEGRACNTVGNGIETAGGECKNYENKAIPENIPKMSEHHGGTQNHSSGVGTVGAHDV